MKKQLHDELLPRWFLPAIMMIIDVVVRSIYLVMLNLCSTPPPYGLARYVHEGDPDYGNFYIISSPPEEEYLVCTYF